MKKGLNIIICTVLIAIIFLLAWQVVKSISAPIKFSNEKETREVQIIERLIDIRNAEVLYKSVNNKYTDNFDTLIHFCQTAEIPVVVMIQKQNMEDSTYYTVYDTLPNPVNIMDTLLKSNSMRMAIVKEAKEDAMEKAKEAGMNEKQIEKEGEQAEQEAWKNFTLNIEDIKWVPFSEPKQTFELEAGIKENHNTGLKVPVFEARTPYEVYLATPGADFSEKEWKQRVDNDREEKVKNSRDPITNEINELSPLYRYPGLKVGSMNEASIDGNWNKL